ncbi:MAG: hypothetical protein IPK83_03585 [Planctomycetes bacterium]|nr:hypothetical protein [Planctomycetota bacterium]
MVYLDDVIDGFVRAMVLPNLEGQCIDLGSGQAISVREVVESISRLMETSIQPAWGEIEDRPSDSTTRTADIRRAEDVLGWKPKTTLAAGLSRTIEWFRSQALISSIALLSCC